MPIADEIATAAVLNELMCRELMPSMMAGLIDSQAAAADATEQDVSNQELFEEKVKIPPNFKHFVWKVFDLIILSQLPIDQDIK